MKKHRALHIAAALACISLITGLSACKDPSYTPVMRGVSLDREHLIMEVGDTFQLVATTTPGATYRRITWASDDTNIVTVDNGLVTAKRHGDANITVTVVVDNTKSVFGYCDVHVYDPEHVYLGEGSDSGLIIGDEKITGLTAGKYYKVVVEDNETYYVRSNGHLSEDMENIGPLTGTQITGLTNGHAYKVNAATPFNVDIDITSTDEAGINTNKATKMLVFDNGASMEVSTTATYTKGTGVLGLPNDGNAVWSIHLPASIVKYDKIYEIMRFSDSSDEQTWAHTKFSGKHKDEPSGAPQQAQATDFKDDKNGALNITYTTVGIYKMPSYHNDWSKEMNIIYSSVEPESTTTFLIIEYGDDPKPGNNFWFLTVEVEE